jgi:hypothetical protein
MPSKRVPKSRNKSETFHPVPASGIISQFDVGALQPERRVGAIPAAIKLGAARSVTGEKPGGGPATLAAIPDFAPITYCSSLAAVIANAARIMGEKADAFETAAGAGADPQNLAP